MFFKLAITNNIIGNIFMACINQVKLLLVTSVWDFQRTPLYLNMQVLIIFD